MLSVSSLHTIVFMCGLGIHEHIAHVFNFIRVFTIIYYVFMCDLRIRVHIGHEFIIVHVFTTIDYV